MATRIALARALCAVSRGAGVVLLDEPTAQLDVRGEAEIFERILAATNRCTTILISHPVFHGKEKRIVSVCSSAVASSSSERMTS
jgi:ABC-type transport system involved in cytochrome bd biosynthesis fused ATPase/permease subunit